MDIIIAIESNDNLLPDRFLGRAGVREGNEAPIGEGGAVRYQARDQKRGSSEIFTFIISVSASIVTNIVSTWIYEHLRHAGASQADVKVDREWFHIDLNDRHSLAELGVALDQEREAESVEEDEKGH